MGEKVENNDGNTHSKSSSCQDEDNSSCLNEAESDGSNSEGSNSEGSNSKGSYSRGNVVKKVREVQKLDYASEEMSRLVLTSNIESPDEDEDENLPKRKKRLSKTTKKAKCYFDEQ